ncbi:MAG: hypothetical protein IKE04_05475 [Oscillospiraceae bacterium]|nr:hypothetical protein [Oscillospiraceae bacterium]
MEREGRRDVREAEERLLRTIRDSDGAYISELTHGDSDQQQRLQSLREAGLIEYCYIGHDRTRMGYRLTLAGRDALDSLELQRQHEAEQHAAEENKELRARAEEKEKKRHDFAVAAFSAAVTLLVEHFPEIIQFFVKLAER